MSVREIPALSTWKLYNKTISTLLKVEFSDNCLQRLANIIIGKSVANIFVYNHNNSISYSDYQQITGKYKTFTRWLLGRLLYFSLNDRVSYPTSTILIDAQLCVLEQLSKTQLDVCLNILNEYLEIFENLIDFNRSKKQEIVLKVFELEYNDNELNEHLDLSPITIEITKHDSNSVILRYLKFLKFILLQDAGYSIFNKQSRNTTIFDNLLFLLSAKNVEIKLEIFQIYLDLLEVSKFNNNSLNLLIIKNLNRIPLFLEQFILEVYDEKIPINTNENRLKFDNIFVKFLKLLDDNSRRQLVQSITQKELNFTKIINNISNLETTGILIIIKEKILESICDYNQLNDVQVYDTKICKIWSKFRWNLLDWSATTNCDQLLKLLNILTRIFIEIKFEIRSRLELVYFDEDHLFKPLLIRINQSINCLGIEKIYEFLTNIPFIFGVKNLFLIVDVLMYPFTNDFNHIGYKTEIIDLLNLSRTGDYKLAALKSLNYLITVISSDLFYVNEETLQLIQSKYLCLIKRVMNFHDLQLQSLVIEKLPYTVDLDQNFGDILAILLQSMAVKNTQIRCKITEILPDLICLTSPDLTKKTVCIRDNNTIKLSTICLKCRQENTIEPAEIYSKLDDIDLSSFNELLLKFLEENLTSIEDERTKISTLEALKCCYQHIQIFQSRDFIKYWIKYCKDPNENIRKKFVETLAGIMQFLQNQAEVIPVCMEEFLELTKISLKTNYNFQTTVLEICEILINNTENEEILRYLLKILIYLIMLPTSQHSMIAINKLFKLCELKSMTTMQLFKQYRDEICEIITHLCSINLILINSTIVNSLQKISITFGYRNSKEFVTLECRYLLPYLVGKIIKIPNVKDLIEEIAVILEIDLSELLAQNYGYIFLKVFLNDTKENFKTCMDYMEKTSHSSGPILRKRNLRIILNELLLNLSEKRDKVLLALTLLTREDVDSKNNNNKSNIQDYLQPRLLGLLQHFDLNLITKPRNKDAVLSSFAEFLCFMNKKYITPLRYKIFAMLRTINYNDYQPQLYCNVWDAFINNCEIETLGPQLATIFVSLLPLIPICQDKINNIFKYLIIDNELVNKDYIKDLFFVDNTNNRCIDSGINTIIRKYTNVFNRLTLKENIQEFLKYLQHETIEIRVYGMKYLKVLMEKDRKDLDKMILGYNGIDTIFIELINILIHNCREKDNNLKLASGELIGELGAIEPSHLPRIYTKSVRNFTFFIDDDAFIINALNELTKALQREKNTHYMDRYALAIQEILKTYDISSSQTSRGYHIWQQFEESQQELIAPLLTSKYIMKQMPNSKFPCPIYGSPTHGSAFQIWLYNWTFSLIQTLPQQLQSNLNVCLPAMKQDNRILMSFLPHILLHSLSDCIDNSEDRVFIEINTVTTSFLDKQKDNNNAHSLNPTVELSDEILESQQCTKIVFVILDFLERWIREWQWQKGALERNNSTFTKIKEFLNKFSRLHLAKCNYYCSEYPRALMYLEDYIVDNQQDVDNHLSFLAEIYAQLDETDGVAGVTALRRSQPPIEDRIRSLEVSGKLSEAICCYQQIDYPLKLQHIRGLIQCNLDLDNTQSALHIIDGCIYNQYIEYSDDLVDLQAEVFWRLGQFEQLDQLLKGTENNSWDIQIGKVLLNFTNGNRDEFANILNDLRLQQVEYLSAASLEEGSYQHGYNYIIKLHILNEINQIEKTTNEILDYLNDSSSRELIENLINNLGKEWELRIKVVQESIKLIEPILCLRRIILQQAKNLIETKQSQILENVVDLFNFHIGSSWLLSAKIARDAGNHLQAYNYLLKAEEYNLKELFLEKAKLYWSKSEYDEALKSLQNGLDKILPTKDLIDSLTVEQKRICSEAKLLIATYNDTLSYVNTEVNIVNYKESIEIYKEWEKNLVCLGQYYDRIFQSIDSQECDSAKSSEMQIHIINYFGKSLMFGTSYIYQSMPRMLSIWFDYGTRLLQQNNGPTKQERKNNLLRMTKLIDTYLERLPTYCFFTAISQIISRICHPQKEVYSELKSIIIKLFLEYPHHSLWMIISIIKSSYTVRAKRCNEILLDSRLKTNNGMQKLIKDFTDLAEKLIELCNKDVGHDITTTTVSALIRSLPRMLQNPNFSEIMIPTHKFRKLVLPNPDFSNSQHNPFPNHYVHIVGIDEEVTILKSLQRPRKITFKGSDGRKYVQMLKPKDDLRKDFRLMEFNDIVNQLLSRESEARQKRLNIRLYSVSPLNEECGLIEWIPDLVGLRPVLMNLYKQRGLGMTARDLKEASCNIRDPLAKKREVFLKQLLPKHPPILGEWFRIIFPDAQSWITARTAYIRTTAVMSMAGYILGLGDRHGENILLDSTNGDAVHVDFNCLFNKGETFEWPERVPFRLTHNMVTAMGPLGVEGVFRNSCACTLKVLRTNTNTLMSIVTPFVYDPLVSWPRNSNGTSHEFNNAERTNEQALDHMKNIELRLKGIVKTRTRTLSIPLSVDGQTNHLINEAISVDNLCQMYIGWGPYL